MAKGMSLHIGVDVVGPTGPGSQTLLGCKNDARAMADLAEAHGFAEREIVLDQDATLNAVVDKLRLVAPEIKKGDIFLFTFAGHGSYIGDEDLDELDRRDETLVLSDLMLCDDVLRHDVWPLFDPGARILMVADSCDSGSVSGLAGESVGIHTAGPQITGNLELSATRHVPDSVNRPPLARGISNLERLQHIVANKEFYEAMFRDLPRSTTIRASVLLLAACPDSTSTADGYPHGAFTQALLDVMKGSGPLNYDDLVQRVATRLSPQTPLLSVIPQADPAFVAERPFSV
jgi:metacaspase-1